MAYIANRPVRFDKDYAVGEIIPETVIDPGMISKLEGMGKISKVTLPGEKTETDTAQNTPQSGADLTADGGEEDKGTNMPTEIETVSTAKIEGENATEEKAVEETEKETEEFKCEKCGKKFKTANALSAHSRSHKK